MTPESQRHVILGCFLSLLFTITNGEVRTWTNDQGRAIEAALVDVEGDKAVLNMNGKNFDVPIESLSTADQEFIGNWKKSAPTDAAAKPEVEPNWDGEWPKMVSVDIDQEIEVIKEDEGTGEYVYASPHYEFICDVKLNTSVVKRFSLLFEATNQFCRELPLGMVKPFREERHKIHLFATREGYESKGGPPGSAGVFISLNGEGDILVPLSSLGVKLVGSNYSVDYDKENTTLSHEIAHQITDFEYYAPGSRGWFTEGMAEYIAQSGYRSGKFDVNDLRKLKDYVPAYGEDGRRGRALGEDITAPDLKEFFIQSYDSFTANANFNYGFGALVVYYFFHMDGEKDAANIKNFLKGLKAGKEGDEMFEPLLAGRTWEELEEDITRGWRSRGIKIEFR
ncbi:MAG: SHD1 domain-containing protein [Verrucomicrobiota bacterium]